MTLTEEYNNDIKTHRNHLYEDFLAHSELFLKWGDRLAKKSKLAKKKKQQLDVYAANIRKRLRKKLVESNLGKEKKDREKAYTSEELSDELYTDPDYKEMWDDLLELESEVFTLKQVCDAFDHRRSSLKYAWEMKKEGYSTINPHEPDDTDPQKLGRKLKT